MKSRGSSPIRTSKATQTCAIGIDPRSPVRLDQLELTRRVNGLFKTITPEPQAQIEGKPTDKSKRSTPVNASTIDHVSDPKKLGTRAPKSVNNTSTNPASDFTGRSRAPSKAASKDSTLNHTSDSFIVKDRLDLENTSSISFGLKNDSVKDKFNRGYMVNRGHMSSALSPFLVDEYMCVEFFRVVFTVEGKVQDIRHRLIKHAQATILDYVSVERADNGEDKKQILPDVRYLGCIVHGTNIEFWELKYAPESSTSSSSPAGQHSESWVPVAGGPGQNHPSSPSLSPFPQCRVHALGSLDISHATNVELCGKFLNHIMCWGLTKYCMRYIDNLHSVCWSLEKWDSTPGKMNLEQANTYWSS